MRSKHTILYLWLVLMTLIGNGCMSKNDMAYPPTVFEGAPRLVIHGSVADDEDHALEGIHVAVYGVRDENEKDLSGYNYALTDTAGEYSIIRYRGREKPTTITIVVTDSTGVYGTTDGDFDVEYDPKGNNGFVEAHFVLKAQ